MNLVLRRSVGAAAVLAALVLAAPAAANVRLTQVSADPFTNTTSQHATEVEPDTFAAGATVIVPFEANTNREEAFRSTDGGQSWRSAVTISAISTAAEPGLRSSALPSAEIDGAGRVYVAWQDCRFRTKCATNDIVLSSSADGVGSSPVGRVPIDPVTSGSDHFIPGLAVDPATSGGSGHLALAYYEYGNAACGTSCQLTVGYISSPDGGAHWGAATQLAGPFPLSEIAGTTQGRMVGDCISTSFNGSGLAVPMFAVGQPPAPPAAFAEAMNVPSDPVPVASPATATATAKSSGVLSAGGTTQRAARAAGYRRPLALPRRRRRFSAALILRTGLGRAFVARGPVTLSPGSPSPRWL